MTAQATFAVTGTRTLGFVPTVQADGSITWAAASAVVANDTITPDKLKTGGTDGYVTTKSGATWIWVDPATQAELDAHAALTTGAHGGIVASSDSRLTNARTPTAHATSHQPGGTDAMAVDAVAATGSLRTLGTGAAQAAAGNDARLSDTRTPTDNSVTSAKIVDGSIVDADVNAAAAIAESKLSLATDAAAGTGSRRTLGTAATQAAAGNDSRLSDSRAPSGTAGGVLSGSFPNPGMAAGAAATNVGAIGGDLTGTLPNPTIGAGKVTSAHILDATIVAADLAAALKPSGTAATTDEALRALGTAAATAAAGNDSRLSNSRTPTAHASTHQPGGSDAMAVDAVAATGSLRTLGTGAAQATAGTDARLSDTRTPTDSTVTAAKVDATLKPSGSAAAGTEALRALGTTAATAAAGNDSRLSDSRAPNGTAGGDLAGTYPNPTIGASKVTSAMIVDATIVAGDLAASVSGLLAGTTGQVAALAGSSGTPSATNLYLTAADNGLRIRAKIVRTAQGIKDETFLAGPFSGYSSPGLSVIVGGLVAGLNGEPITGAGFVVGTLNTPTSCWVALYRSSTNVRVALSADTPSAVGTNGLRTIAFTAAYTPAADEALYVCVLQVGGTAATLARGNNGVANQFIGVGAGVGRFIQQAAATFPDPLVPAATAYPVYMFIY